MVPEHIGAIRLSAELFTLMTRHEAIYFWEKLDRLGQSDLADTLGHVRALFLLGRQKEAEQLMGALLSASGSIQQG